MFRGVGGGGAGPDGPGRSHHSPTAHKVWNKVWNPGLAADGAAWRGGTRGLVPIPGVPEHERGRGDPGRALRLAGGRLTGAHTDNRSYFSRDDLRADGAEAPSALRLRRRVWLLLPPISRHRESRPDIAVLPTPARVTHTRRRVCRGGAASAGSRSAARSPTFRRARGRRSCACGSIRPSRTSRATGGSASASGTTANGRAARSTRRSTRRARRSRRARCATTTRAARAARRCRSRSRGRM